MLKDKKICLSKSKKYLSLVATLPSCISGQYPCNVHHIKFNTGMGQKSPDWWCIPLTPEEHQHSNEAYHVIGKRAWERLHNVTEIELARKTQERLRSKITIPEQYRLTRPEES